MAPRCSDRRPWPWCAPLPPRWRPGGRRSAAAGRRGDGLRACRGSADRPRLLRDTCRWSSSTGHGSVDDGAVGVGTRVVSHGGVQGIPAGIGESAGMPWRTPPWLTTRVPPTPRHPLTHDRSTRTSGMCRAVVEGGRRCPARAGSVAAPTSGCATPPPPPQRWAHHGHGRRSEGTERGAIEPRRRYARPPPSQRGTDGARDADRSGDPDVHEAYLNAVLDHGAVLRDIADQKIEQPYAAHTPRDRARALRKVGIGCARWLFGPIHGQGLRRNPPHRTVLLRP